MANYEFVYFQSSRDTALLAVSFFYEGRLSHFVFFFFVAKRAVFGFLFKLAVGLKVHMNMMSVFLEEMKQ